MTQILPAQTGVYETPNASKYLQQLCKHFGHKIPTSFDDTSGTLDFGFGRVTLAADDSRLVVQIPGGDNDGLDRAPEVIDKHLVRFAFREDFQNMTWSQA